MGVTNNKNNESADNLTELERRVADIEAQVNDIRKIAAAGHEAQNAANEQTRRSLSAMANQLDELQEHVYPTFFRVFPKQGEFLDEVDRLLASRREK